MILELLYALSLPSFLSLHVQPALSDFEDVIEDEDENEDEEDRQDK